ncbi:MAG: rRNA maturation RNase YbeY [Phycisphaerae bacterium]|nr:rRNA maturation RNase YbeY [Phycisphaerae bacterium]NUQ45664.1 rRNA maturation RNase YbeY [Phycisphaerae bacterium]
MSRRAGQGPAAQAQRDRHTSSAANRFRIQLHSCPRGWADVVRRAVRLALRLCRHSHDGGASRSRAGSLSIAFVSDDQIAALNESWLRHVGPTDVLTFDLRDDPDADRIDGQIVVSLDTARREARRRGHAPRDEALLYVVHGVLHLLGYDDRRAAQRREMHEKEDEVLHALGVGRVYHSRRRGGTRRARK